MAKVRFEPDEVILAELSPSRRSAFFPIVELILITGLIWMAIGLIDGHLASQSVQILGFEPNPLTRAGDLTQNDTLISLVWGRRALLVLWVILAWRRCIRHLVFRQRSRMVLTDQRLITATGHLRSEIAQVPLGHIVDARHRGQEVSVYVAGTRMPVVLRQVPYAKKFTKLLRNQIGQF
ncbi:MULTISPECIES: hypothetical protein [Corynebacterium]|uniref:hypothetical protein n=1 Tax=Corynebacterium TaxID=1716 RepID=UPI0008A58BA2|nr:MULTISPECIES: hypothetical protein [Corynebacterium]MCX2162225.1 hypothetical protein [Corynebacterium auriscanis]OFT90153.1 hypothetical protein HMPREF3098_03740 [Corynebacterium sp. HMSC28B08]